MKCSQCGENIAQSDIHVDNLHFECWNKELPRIPTEIQQAALKVGNWLKKQNITDWELFDIKSQ